uniref:G-protein coupled receptors family 1 profile domain-containing protein n=1 Tax=Cyanistes caeruleus TaxID=156563 RepID=A0A8C0V7H6_CYACU
MSWGNMTWAVKEATSKCLEKCEPQSWGHNAPPAQRPPMKVSTVFPHFSAQTNGPVPCEISVSAVIIHIVTLLICLCGLAGNGVVLWLLNINTITNYIFNQATMDFLFLIFMVPSTLLFLHEEVSCSTIMPWMYFSLLFQLSQFSYNIGLYRLTFISFYRCKSILCLVFCGCQLPLRLLRAMRTTLFWAFFFVFIFVNPMVTSQCQSQEQEHCQVALLSMYVLSFFLFATPMLISSIIVFVHFKRGSQQREQKRLDIVIFLTALLSLPLSLLYLLQQLEYVFVSTQVIFLLTCINSSIKPFIYFLVGSWKSLRMALQRVFEEPEENTATMEDWEEILPREGRTCVLAQVPRDALAAPSLEMFPARLDEV